MNNNSSFDLQIHVPVELDYSSIRDLLCEIVHTPNFFSAQNRHQFVEEFLALRFEGIDRPRELEFVCTTLRRKLTTCQKKFVRVCSRFRTTNGEICSICRVKTHPSKHPVKLLCNHVFHQSCILKWFEHRHNCPMCRRQVALPPPGALNVEGYLLHPVDSK